LNQGIEKHESYMLFSNVLHTDASGDSVIGLGFMLGYRQRQNCLIII